MDDGRPMNTDVFLSKLYHNHSIDAYDTRDAIKAWVYGDWSEAMKYLECEEK